MEAIMCHADNRNPLVLSLVALAQDRIAGAIPQQFALEMKPGALGSISRPNAIRETNMCGVIACGYAARPMASIAVAFGVRKLPGAPLRRSSLFGHLGHD